MTTEPRMGDQPVRPLPLTYLTVVCHQHRDGQAWLDSVCLLLDTSKFDGLFLPETEVFGSEEPVAALAETPED